MVPVVPCPIKIKCGNFYQESYWSYYAKARTNLLQGGEDGELMA
jgi:hypothetical protein